MATIQVRDVPDEAYATFARRAKQAGRSLQSYMREQLIELAEQPTDEELFAEIERNVKRMGVRVDVTQLLDDIHDERDA